MNNILLSKNYGKKIFRDYSGNNNFKRRRETNREVHPLKIKCICQHRMQGKKVLRPTNISILRSSPDLNIIENCWAELSQTVYAQGKQINSLKELKTCIVEKLGNIWQKYIKKKSLPKQSLSESVQ